METFNADCTNTTSNNAKNYIIAFGVIISLFLITSFDHGRSAVAPIVEIDQPQIETLISADNYQTEKISIEATSYHNFLASYFINESSVERQRRVVKEKKPLFSGLKRIQKSIVALSHHFF